MVEFYRIKPNRSLIQHSLWHWDAYPELPDLEPHSEIELGNITGPGIVKTIHLTLSMPMDSKAWREEHNFTGTDGMHRDILLRNVYLQIEYDNSGYKSVNVPVGDFFCDSFAGKSINFSSIVMAKRPDRSLFCYAPMPFKEHIRITLVNKTEYKVTGLGYVAAERVPEWEDDFSYFHANWSETTVKLPDEYIVPMLNTEGAGHFFGCHMTVTSACPHFKGNMGICEGNDEFYIDGAKKPYDYLGTEDFFGFSWNWQHLWSDDYSGTTYLYEDENIGKLATYRFLLDAPVRFSESLKVQINYKNEIHNHALKAAKKDGSGGTDFKIVSYWYQDKPVMPFLKFN